MNADEIVGGGGCELARIPTYRDSALVRMTTPVCFEKAAQAHCPTDKLPS